MDRNLLLAFALSFAVLMLWTMLVEPPPPAPTPTGVPVAEESAAAPPPPASPEAPPGLPPLEPVRSLPAEPGAVPASPMTRPGREIVLDTALYRARLDTRGAGIAHWELKDYQTEPGEGGGPVELTTGDPPYDVALVTPFTELAIGDLSEVVFEIESEGPERFAFRTTRDGITVRKVYRFRPDSYAFDLEVRVENGGVRPIAPRFAVTWPASRRAGQDFREQSLAALHEGGVEAVAVSSLGVAGFFGGGEKEQVFPREIDWAGVRTTYFIAALLPDSPAQASARFVALLPGESGVAQVFFDPVEIPPGASAERVFRGYIGPKVPERLEAVGGGLVRSIDLGWSWMVPLTRFFGWLLGVIYTFVPNYGVAIILLTILVRVVTTPLTAKQMRSMERMRALAPKLQELKEKHGDDRQKQSEEMMRLYRQEGVNPLGGCFPMLLQLPVFIGLFYALRASIQLRHAPFVGWIDDLSAPETLFTLPGLDFPVRLLPLVMGVTMFAQQKLTPMQQMDPAQQRMMMVMMPVMMTVISYTFPSGLVLYWMVSNVLAISHQLWVGRGLRAGPGSGTPQRPAKAAPSAESD